MNDTTKIPTSIPQLLGYRQECACGRLHAVDTTRVVLGAGVIDEIVPLVREQVGRGRVALVTDARLDGIAGQRVARLLESDGQRVVSCLLPDGAGGRPHADEHALAVAETALAGADVAVAVGAGTVNDVTKLASFQRSIPYLCVATAPSMNGYTSAIAAISRRGVKRTESCHQPRAVVASLDLLVAAPLELTRAGLGDLESKPTATADYRLAATIRGEYHCAAPEIVVRDAERRAADAAAGIGRGDPAAIGVLTEALLLSGFSMKLAGTSSPASGGEHLISHLWDMTAAAEGRVEGWHGAQVGVTTIVTATLYERLREIDPATIEPERIAAAWPGDEDREKDIRRRHGALADEVLAELRAKELRGEPLVAELRRIRDGWDGLWIGLDDSLRPGARVREILSAAGAPVTVRQLGLTADHLRRAFIDAREIRGRFTVLDLAAELGVLETLRDEVLARSGCLA